MPFHVECLQVGLDFVVIANRKSFVMHERASGLALGWDRSPFVGEDCVGLGAIDLGATLTLGLSFWLRSFPFALLALRRFILFRLPLIVMPLFFFM